jgi:hypothetical protein
MWKGIRLQKGSESSNAFVDACDHTCTLLGTALTG